MTRQKLEGPNVIVLSSLYKWFISERQNSMPLVAPLRPAQEAPRSIPRTFRRICLEPRCY